MNTLTREQRIEKLTNVSVGAYQKGDFPQGPVFFSKINLGDGFFDADFTYHLKVAETKAAPARRADGAILGDIVRFYADELVTPA